MRVPAFAAVLRAAVRAAVVLAGSVCSDGGSAVAVRLVRRRGVVVSAALVAFPAAGAVAVWLALVALGASGALAVSAVLAAAAAVAVSAVLVSAGAFAFWFLVPSLSTGGRAESARSLSFSRRTRSARTVLSYFASAVFAFARAWSAFCERHAVEEAVQSGVVRVLVFDYDGDVAQCPGDLAWQVVERGTHLILEARQVFEPHDPVLSADHEGHDRLLRMQAVLGLLPDEGT